jgi:hypothetical protein
MRLWTLHARYLDPKSLVALWREALLAQRVLKGKTGGDRHHPQLERFKAHQAPVAAIATYLAFLFSEASKRGYRFDSSKIEAVHTARKIFCTRGQLLYEWELLKSKLAERDPPRYRELMHEKEPQAHPLFVVRPGAVESWETASKKA